MQHHTQLLGVMLHSNNIQQKQNHFWSNEMGNEDLMVAPKAPRSPWRRIHSWRCGIYPAERDTGKRQVQTRDQALHPDTQSENRMGWEHPVLRISKHFFGPWCKGKTPQVCTLVQPAPLSRWREVKTSAASALQPGCALIHPGGSWEPALISGCVPGIFRRRTLVKSRRKRSRFYLCEHILHNWSSMKLH